MTEALTDILQQERCGSVLISSHGIALSTLFQKICEDAGCTAKDKIMAEHGKLYLSEVQNGRLSIPEMLFAEH